ncbi:hypothetical protein OUZ56_029996 [Daphnia magna]|uniref:Uncharacterized protein n=1 Tax=Daphnia magna TaxID=35525 RepID=A0ABR0B8E3_9CRUS|nr:hypothetical protein OUZ56_029996 [Daphnia magna]
MTAVCGPRSNVKPATHFFATFIGLASSSTETQSTEMFPPAQRPTSAYMWLQLYRTHVGEGEQRAGPTGCKQLSEGSAFQASSFYTPLTFGPVVIILLHEINRPVQKIVQDKSFRRCVTDV